jgi:hypothetical protein
MAFCSKCGSEILEGVDFCGNCGARLAEENIDLQQNIQHTISQKPLLTVPSINTNNISNHLKENLAITWNMLIKPVSTIKNLVHTLDQKSTVILAVIFALIQGILSLWKLQSIISSFDKTIASFVTKLSASMGSIMGQSLGGSLNPSSSGDLLGLTKVYNGVKQLIKIPYGKAFLHGIILYLIVVGILFLGIFIAAKLLSKTPANTLNIGKVTILATIPAIGGEFLNIIFSYFSSSLGIFVLLLGLLVSFTTLIMNIKEAVNIEDDKIVYVLSLIFSIVIVCSLFAVWKFILSDVNSIKNSIMNDLVDMLK